MYYKLHIFIRTHFRDMQMRNSWIFSLPLIFFSSIVLSQGDFEPPVIIEPPNPTVGDNIRVGVFKERFPPCLVLPVQNLDGETHIFDFDSTLPEFPENHIDLIVVAESVPICVPFPVSPAPREFYDLGQLPEGEYSLRTGVIGPITQFPLPPDQQPLQFGEILVFNVQSGAVEPVAVSVMSVGFMLVNVLMILIFVYLKIFRRSFIKGK